MAECVVPGNAFLLVTFVPPKVEVNANFLEVNFDWSIFVTYAIL